MGLCGSRQNLRTRWGDGAISQANQQGPQASGGQPRQGAKAEPQSTQDQSQLTYSNGAKASDAGAGGQAGKHRTRVGDGDVDANQGR